MINFIYKTSLNFSNNTLDKILNEILKLDNNIDTKNTNFLDKDNEILEKYFFIKLLVSRIQEILFNTIKDKKSGINFIDIDGGIEITEITYNIYEYGKSQISTKHDNSGICGIFNLTESNSNSEYNHTSDGSLIIIKDKTINYLNNIDKCNSESLIIHWESNLGIIFSSNCRSIFVPHYSNKKHINISFKARLNKNYCYEELYPKPYWFPIKYNIIVNKDNYNPIDKILTIPFNISNKWCINGNNESIFLKANIVNANPIGLRLKLNSDILLNIVNKIQMNLIFF